MAGVGNIGSPSCKMDHKMMNFGPSLVDLSLNKNLKSLTQKILGYRENGWVHDLSAGLWIWHIWTGYIIYIYMYIYIYLCGIWCIILYATIIYIYTHTSHMYTFLELPSYFIKFAVQYQILAIRALLGSPYPKNPRPSAKPRSQGRNHRWPTTEDSPRKTTWPEAQLMGELLQMMAVLYLIRTYLG